MEFLAAEFAVAKDLHHQPGADDLTRVHRHDGHPTVGMVKKVMASLYANDLEPHPLECRDDVLTRQPRSRTISRR